jgi:hypothetical protein
MDAEGPLMSTRIIAVACLRSLAAIASPVPPHLEGTESAGSPFGPPVAIANGLYSEEADSR